MHYDFDIPLVFKEAKNLLSSLYKLHPRGTEFVILDKFAKQFLN